MYDYLVLLYGGLALLPNSGFFFFLRFYFHFAHMFIHATQIVLKLSKIFAESKRNALKRFLKNSAYTERWDRVWSF